MSDLMPEFNRANSVMHLLLRSTQALLSPMSQTAVCNRHHRVDQQICRWLLLFLDRPGINRIVMTQELAANMLGVRRAGITETVGHMQSTASSNTLAAKSPCWTGLAWKSAAASAMRWTSGNTTNSCRTPLPADLTSALAIVEACAVEGLQLAAAPSSRAPGTNEQSRCMAAGHRDRGHRDPRDPRPTRMTTGMPS